MLEVEMLKNMAEVGLQMVQIRKMEERQKRLKQVIVSLREDESRKRTLRTSRTWPPWLVIQLYVPAKEDLKKKLSQSQKDFLIVTIQRRFSNCHNPRRILKHNQFQSQTPPTFTGVRGTFTNRCAIWILLIFLAQNKTVLPRYSWYDWLLKS